MMDPTTRESQIRQKHAHWPSDATGVVEPESDIAFLLDRIYLLQREHKFGQRHGGWMSRQIDEARAVIEAAWGVVDADPTTRQDRINSLLTMLVNHFAHQDTWFATRITQFSGDSRIRAEAHWASLDMGHKRQIIWAWAVAKHHAYSWDYYMGKFMLTDDDAELVGYGR